MTSVLIVVAASYAEAQAAMADRITTGDWYWASSFSVARRWIERAESRGVDVSATILVAGLRKAAA